MKQSALATPLATSFAALRAEDAFHADVLSGLGRRPRRLPPKYFYDAQGSQLFDRICALPEYYLARAELAILRAHADEIAELVGPRALLVELGSGSSIKTRLLLDQLRHPAGYVPVDIARGHLAASVQALQRDYPGLRIAPVCADFTRAFSLPATAPLAAARRRVAFFPGSTIGNLDPSEAALLLRRLRRLVGHGGGLVIGVDLKKESALLEAAYNDAQGVTAAFNLNLLLRINRELDGDFDPDSFAHLAFYNFQLGRVEMHLLSLRDQLVSVARRRLSFRRGETIHTENSYKYVPEDFACLAAGAGFAVRRSWYDCDGLFAVMYLEA